MPVIDDRVPVPAGTLAAARPPGTWGRRWSSSRGSSAELSAVTISRLTAQWQAGYGAPGRRGPHRQSQADASGSSTVTPEPDACCPGTEHEDDMALVDNAIYVDGQRTADPRSLEETYELLRDRHGMAWIGLYRPDVAEIRSVAGEFDLHPLAVEDAIAAHQRAKLERYGTTLFTVLRPARYVDDVERVEFGELHVFTGQDFVVTIRHAEAPDLGRVRDRMEQAPALLRLGPEAVLYAILDQVVDEYAPVVAGLENDIDEIEDQLFKGDPAVSRRIYELSREVIEFQRATRPLLDMLTSLEAGFDKYKVDLELQRSLRDVHDHAIRIVERADSFRALLQNALTVQTTLVGQQQNDEMRSLTEASLAQNEEVKKISAWAAILFAPTLVGTIYGMNFDHMPELHWLLGYPLALALMLITSVTLYLVFKRRSWL
jgi:magnesium transporter